MVRLLPGDPTLLILGQAATQEQIEILRVQLGLDKPLLVQYAIFMRDLFKLDLGRSTRTHELVLPKVLERFRNTLELAIAAMIVATFIGVLAGIISATRPYSIFDSSSMLVALFGVSMPVFWLGIMLILVFSLYLGLFPTHGRGTLLHLVLPAVTLGAASAAIIARMTRSTMLEVLRQEYIMTARSKGLLERVVIYKHALKNALIPVVTVVGLQFGTLLSGAVLTETVFAWPGVGRLVIEEGILTRDYPIIQGAVLAIAFSFVLINLIVDLLYAYIDPRIRYE